MLRIESLERRDMLAAVAVVNGDLLTIKGDAADAVEIRGGAAGPIMVSGLAGGAESFTQTEVRVKGVGDVRAENATLDALTVKGAAVASVNASDISGKLIVRGTPDVRINRTEADSITVKGTAAADLVEITRTDVAGQLKIKTKGGADMVRVAENTTATDFVLATQKGADEVTIKSLTTTTSDVRLGGGDDQALLDFLGETDLDCGGGTDAVDHDAGLTLLTMDGCEVVTVLP